MTLMKVNIATLLTDSLAPLSAFLLGRIPFRSVKALTDSFCALDELNRELLFFMTDGSGLKILLPAGFVCGEVMHIACK